MFEKRRRGRGPFRFAIAVSMLLWAVGCAETDQDVYLEGDPGSVTLLNGLPHKTLWLGGCSVFVQERLEAGHWIDHGGEWTCVWEGLATPVAPKASRTDEFTARSPGTWRLAYDVGFGCQPDQPLSGATCDLITRRYSNTFEVLATDEGEGLCLATGGVWDPLSCGHYSCGLAPDCDAIVPGCDCGPFSVFEETVGCLAVPCGAPRD